MTQEKNRSRPQLAAFTAALGLLCAAPLSHAAASASSWAATQTGAFTNVVSSAVSRGELRNGDAIHVALSLALRDRAGLDSFLAEQMRAGSPAYGQTMSQDQFVAHYAPTAAQVKAVSAYLSKMGFINIVVDANRQLVSADGSAATVNAAFNTRMEGFSVGDRVAFANTLPAKVPAELGGVVLSVLGLQNVLQAHTMIKQGDLNTAAAQPNAAVPTGHLPTEFPAIYGVGSTTKGSNAKVAIVASGDISQSITDLRQFETQNALIEIPVQQINVGPAGTDTGGVPEWDLDSQDIQGMAGNVKKLVFYVITSLANSDLTAGFNQIVTDNSVKIINVSLGECETGAKLDGSMAADDQLFAQAVAQGQVFSISTGDSGSDECGKRNGQSFPAVSPYVMAIGGTTLFTEAGAYSSEKAWSGGGGGPSIYEPKPDWQAGVGSSSFRSVPDVSLDADPKSGAILVVNGGSAQYGGTSLSAPLFCGIYARLLSGLGSSLPFPDPTIYSSAPSNSTYKFLRDVTKGSNGDWTAAAGWDYTTGWGSLRIANYYSLVKSTLATP
jgi:pseudomonalisin